MLYIIFNKITTGLQTTKLLKLKLNLIEKSPTYLVSKVINYSILSFNQYTKITDLIWKCLKIPFPTIA